MKLIKNSKAMKRGSAPRYGIDSSGVHVNFPTSKRFGFQYKRSSKETLRISSGGVHSASPSNDLHLVGDDITNYGTVVHTDHP